ncbi:hypothetical protein PAPYR_2178 [Paratrimastix pyriformis]|uniref:Uncharacterized protein n=1 Tax=Paratrimastix pyriformis TaxID=342808 RepID=A0ABQ8UR15_9EUKA|nr:hypothetical protein PAPYR_2178 [Paratrimastix pyriformis]|eukprot:GAFH01005941.1.p2 GENE.GAFH01005941.1~~GAFH01005941.1.p2  ORF type:complete len:162 (-),score=52.66 GAFH01005941.1:40-525(-)
MRFGIVVVFAALCGLAMARPERVGEHDWRSCHNFPVLNETCIEVFLNEQSLNVSIRLIVNNHTVFEEDLSATHLCLDDTELIKLIELVPALAPYKKLIDEIVKVRKFIPAEVFSVCLDVEDLEITKKFAKGCVDMDIVLMCWEKKCLWKGTEPMGCFNIPL